MRKVIDVATCAVHHVPVVVMASAARRGDIDYTSDFDDLQRLHAAFPAVRVLAV